MQQIIAKFSKFRIAAAQVLYLNARLTVLNARAQCGELNEVLITFRYCIDMCYGF